MEFNSKSTGSILLYDGVTGHARLGQNPIRELNSEGEDIYPRLPSEGHFMGYLAYPNPTLKNDIPAMRFFEYEKIEEVADFSFENTGTFSTSGDLQQSVSKIEYLQKIAEIKELLAAGEIYQLNYAIRFRKAFSGDPFALYQTLCQVNPAAFSAFVNAGDFQIISLSPERLFKVEEGMITTQPIKGTLSKDQDVSVLLESEKERAELDMITDLERNDVGRVCEYGTLALTKEREVMELPNLWHAYSEVQGQLRSDATSSDIISAMFPGGSITGCPKRRAMEHIERLEALPRNIFTGSIGYVSSSGPASRGSNSEPNSGNHDTINDTTNNRINYSMDFNICIRTLLIRNGQLEFWAGGGIVMDSDPESEYAECMLKAQKFLEVI